MQSTPPQGGPSFNQMMLIAMIVAMLLILGLLVFDPHVRLDRNGNGNAVPTNNNGNNNNNGTSPVQPYNGN